MPAVRAQSRVAQADGDCQERVLISFVFGVILLWLYRWKTFLRL